MKKGYKSRKRRIQRNRRIAVLICMVFLSISIAVLFGNTNATANQNSYKYYTDYTVEHGDSLWSIAEQYCTKEYASMNDYIKEVQMINNITDQISYGQQLVVPYYSEELK